MIPGTFGALLAFLGLIAPGITFDLVLERRRPRQENTTFREINRVALASLSFTLAAVALLGLLRLAAPMAVPDVPQWIVQGNRYISDHPDTVFAGIGLDVFLACTLAALSGWFLTRKSTAAISSVGAWYRTLRQEPPPNTRPWIHVQLEDETEFWGYLRHYTPNDGAKVREIVLGGSTLQWRRKGDEARSPIGSGWDAVCVNADRIEYMRVIYKSISNGTLYGRKTRQTPNGTPRQPIKPAHERQTTPPTTTTDGMPASSPHSTSAVENAASPGNAG